MDMKNENAINGPSNNPLGSAPIASLIRKFAIPSIISMLVSAAYNITDQIFIGQVVGMLGNAATNVAFPTIMRSVMTMMVLKILTSSLSCKDARICVNQAMVFVLPLPAECSIR